MWQVDEEVKLTTSGIGGQVGYGFNVTDARGAPLLSISHRTREESEKARALMEQAIAGAITVLSY